MKAATKRPDRITRGALSIPSPGASSRESLLDYISRMTRGHGAMCPCEFCAFARAM